MKRLIVIALLCLLLVACKDANKPVIDKTDPFIGGTEGVSFDFLNLRSSVFDGNNDPFDIVVKLENKGEFTIPRQSIRVSVSGINPAEFGKVDEALALSPEDDVRGVRKDTQGNFLKSSPVTVEFSGLSYLGKVVGASQKFPLAVDICHLYGTTAVSYMCLLSDVLSTKEGTVCKVQETKKAFNSGAPVQVQNVQEFERGKDKVGFTFDIKQVGTGALYEQKTKCVNERFKNKVLVNVDTKIPGLTCTSLGHKQGTEVEGSIVLIDGSKTISCTQQVNQRSDFEQPITITLLYDYNLQKRADIIVKASER